MSELDDFFAKKDRKKSKGKKFVSVEDKGKGKSDDAKKADKGVKKERIPREDGEDGSIPEQEADEWKEFEEEKKDYSGLKLGHLSISDNATADGGDIGDDGSNDGGADIEDGANDGEHTNERSHTQPQHSGPWKRVNPQQPQKEPNPATDSSTNGPPDKQQQPPVEELTLKKATGAYIPPGLRNPQMRSSSSSGAAGSQPLLPMRMRGMRAAAPDIHNEDYFPTLAAGTPASKDKQGAFEIVSHGRSAVSSRVPSTTSTSSALRTSAPGQQQQSSQLTLGNRFNTLSQNDS